MIEEFEQLTKPFKLLVVGGHIQMIFDTFLTPLEGLRHLKKYIGFVTIV
jgi:hypothetical protein